MANHYVLNARGEDISHQDSWRALSVHELPEGIALTEIPLSELLHLQEKANILLPLTDLVDPAGKLAGGLLQQVYELLIRHTSRLGVWLSADTDAETLVTLSAFLLKQALIVIHVPVFANGRGFSLARILRHLGYDGEIRMSGAYGRDQIAYLLRVGVDSFVISEHDMQSDLHQAFDALASAYDGEHAAALPLFSGG